MTNFDKEQKIHELKYQKHCLVIEETGILEAINQIPAEIYDPTNPQIISMRKYVDKLMEKEKEIELKIIEVEATYSLVGE